MIKDQIYRVTGIYFDPGDFLVGIRRMRARVRNWQNAGVAYYHHYKDNLFAPPVRAHRGTDTSGIESSTVGRTGRHRQY